MLRKRVLQIRLYELTAVDWIYGICTPRKHGMDQNSIFLFITKKKKNALSLTGLVNVMDFMSAKISEGGETQASREAVDAPFLEVFKARAAVNASVSNLSSSHLCSMVSISLASLSVYYHQRAFECPLAVRIDASGISDS
ncbi:hypothetical protein WISP_22575 [Willisornis vidua]|uniref:Uncharacterized protein n=1 Tax=Willisornis vidua TaxID=1566151 RepID=A0ABQ9DMT6_9PASS|nr:hypothetical protein WISP_22575 [Willisornis vidua]